MKTFSQFKESIIDIPRSNYAHRVFNNDDTAKQKIQ